MKFNGTALKAGDPKWVDTNNDQVISSEDKVLVGNMLPRVAGGFTNQFFYQKWSLTADLYFNLGRKILNQEMANRFDFINREGTNTIDAVKEITFWEKRGEYDKYPLYNPWSTVIPYRAEQDLFLENGAFLKMRTLSLSYDMSEWLNKRTAVIKKLRVYISGHNLFTITPYTGQDPELVNYTGYDTGYGLPIPRTYTLGVQVEL
jgi:TonB-dependent starch-binding outer membrane protein SusC